MPGLRLLAMSIAAFGALGWLLADRVFVSQEALYRGILRTGAKPPAEKPQMQISDRRPALAVAIVAGLLAAGITALLIAYW